MGDYSDFCESYGGDASDPDFMDNWLEKYASGNTPIDKYISKNEENKFKQEYKLTDKAWEQVKEYVLIYKKHSFKQHYEVNNYITKNSLWGNFTEMRSMNDHGSNVIVHGITKKYFRLICEILEITGANGKPLIKAEKY